MAASYPILPSAPARRAAQLQRCSILRLCSASTGYFLSFERILREEASTDDGRAVDAMPFPATPAGSLPAYSSASVTSGFRRLEVRGSLSPSPGFIAQSIRQALPFWQKRRVCSRPCCRSYTCHSSPPFSKLPSVAVWSPLLFGCLHPSHPSHPSTCFSLACWVDGQLLMGEVTDSTQTQSPPNCL